MNRLWTMKLPLSLGLVLVLALNACSGSGGGQNGGGSLTIEQLAMPDESGLTPVDGGTVRVGAAGGGLAADLNPNNAFAGADFLRAAALYNKLTDYDDNGAVVPSLAAKIEPNDDATRWHIELRPDVRFSDGSTLTADDVLYTWRTIIEGSWKAATLLEVIDMEATQATDDLNLEVVLTRPVATIPEYLAAEGQFIIKEGFSDYRDANGTGPFDLESWNPTDRAVMTKKDDYWGDEVHLDGLEIVEVSDLRSAVNALRSGQIDMLPKVPPAELAQLANDDRFYLVNQPGAVEASFYMREDVPPFNNKALRSAMKMVLDRQKCIDVGGGGVGRLGNDLPGPASVYYATDIPQRTQDIEGARKLLEEAGLENPEVELTVGPTNPAMVPCAQVLQADAQKAGIKINIKTIPPEETFNRDAGYMQRTFGMTEYNGLPIEVFIPGFLFEGARNNDVHLAGQEAADFEDKYWDAVGTLDDDARMQKFLELQQDIHENRGYIIWGSSGITWAVSNDVHGGSLLFAPNPTLNFGKGFERIWIEQ